jgi:transcriptional regulator GlxA family with amidase domain
MRERHAILLLPRGPLLPAAGAIEALRAGNALLGGRALEVLLVSPDGRPVRCAGGETVQADAALDRCGDLAGLFVVADAPPTAADADWVAQSLQPRGRELDRRSGALGGIGCGAAWWAQAGLMNGYRCCVTSVHASETALRWPHAMVGSGHHVHDRNRWTCAGGTASHRPGDPLARGAPWRAPAASSCWRISAWSACARSDERQSAAARGAPGGSAKLAEAVALMEANLGEPLSTEDIARLVGVSRRQLERLFKQHLDDLPSRWYAGTAPATRTAPAAADLAVDPADRPRLRLRLGARISPTPTAASSGARRATNAARAPPPGAAKRQLRPRIPIPPGPA